MIRLLKLVKPEYLDWYLAKDENGGVWLYKKEPTLDVVNGWWDDVDSRLVFLYEGVCTLDLFKDYDYKTPPIKVRDLIDRKYFEKTGKKFDLKSYSKDRGYNREDVIKYHSWALMTDGKETIILDGQRTFLDENLRHLKSSINWEVDI